MAKCKYCGDSINRAGYCVRCGYKVPTQGGSSSSYGGGNPRPNANLRNATDDIRNISQNYKDESARLRQQAKEEFARRDRERAAKLAAAKANKGQASSGGCYVATCVYGSYDCPEVWVLRRFRDYYLSSTWYGRAFIKTYYTISPSFVKWFGHTLWFKKLWKYPLDRMVTQLKDKGVADDPYDDFM